MDEYLKEALEIVKAQAGVRVMTEEEMGEMVQRLSVSIRYIADNEGRTVADPPVDPKKAIREKTIICLESGKAYKILTRKHLAKFGLTPDEYREKWGYSKKQSLVCKSLQRDRRKRMKDMQLWTKREVKQ